MAFQVEVLHRRCTVHMVLTVIRHNLPFSSSNMDTPISTRRFIHNHPYITFTLPVLSINIQRTSNPL